LAAEHSERKDNDIELNVLLGVVTGMGEKARVETTTYPITTNDDDPMLPCFDEVILDQYFPLRVNELTVAERHERIAWGLSGGGLAGGKSFESTR
jgi:hypothetical protein